MEPQRELFGPKLHRLRASAGMSIRDLAAVSGVEPSLISRVENGRKAAGPVTIEKLAQGLELVGSERDRFIQAGTSQSKRTAQAFGPTMPNPFFRSVLCDLLRALEIGGEVREFQAEAVVSDIRYDLIVQMMDGTKLGLEFKPGKILVATTDATSALPPPTEHAVLAHGGFVAEIKIRRGGSRS